MKVSELFEDEKLNDAMMRIRKSSSVTPKQIILVATALGWNVEEKMGVYQDPYLNSSSLLDNVFDLPRGTFHCHAISNKNEKEMVYEIGADDEKSAYTIIKEMEKYVVNTVPETPKRSDKLFIRNIGEVYDKREKSEHKISDYRPIVFNCSIWIPAKTITFTNKEGESIRVVQPSNMNTFDMNPFVQSDLYKQFKTEVIDYLGLGTIEQEREKKIAAAKATALGDNAGHCEICGALQKLRKVGDHYVMVHHGYQRPGHGYIVGDCFGVNYQPYEKSTEALVAYLPRLKNYLRDETQRLHNLMNGRVKSFKLKRRHQDIIITPDDVEWEQTLKNHITATERQIEFINDDIDSCQKKINNWVEKPLPFELKNKE